MTATAEDSSNELYPHELRIDRLLGRRVLAPNGRPAGRLEEFRAEVRDGQCIVTVSFRARGWWFSSPDRRVFSPAQTMGAARDASGNCVR